MRKPRSDSALANLQPQQRDALADWLLDGMSYVDAKEKLHMDFAVETSTAALGGFYQHFCAPLRLRRAAQAADALPELSGGLMANWDASSIALVKQLYFEIAASPTPNPESLFFLMQQIASVDKGKLDREKLEFARQKHAETNRLKTQTLALQREKFETDATALAVKHAAEIKTITGDRTINAAEQSERVRRLLFPQAFANPEEAGAEP